MSGKRPRRTTLATARRVFFSLAVTGTAFAPAFAEAPLVPLPEDVFTSSTPNPVIDLADRMISSTGNSLTPAIPDALSIQNEGGTISIDAENRALLYSGGQNPVHLLTDEGLDVEASVIRADLETHTATLDGPLTVYQGESLTRASSGSYNWETQELDIQDVRTKVNGLLVRGSRIEYRKDDQGRTFLRIHDAYVSTEDIRKPSTWVGTGELTVYPGDYGRLTRLSLSSGEMDIPIPILGWFSFSHSLNAREGYMPQPGTKSTWGAYLLNRYGFLLGNRRVEGGIPVADYILTAHADYRSRRGGATGLDLEDVAMKKRYHDMTGLSTYYVADQDPMINPTDTPRASTKHNRYRVAMQALWETEQASSFSPVWSLATNVNVLSDQYMLRDFLEEVCRANDKPDNTVRLERRGRRSQTMLLTRFAPNNFYTTDERAELSYYRVRTAIGQSRINYETRNSFAAMRQDIPALVYMEYRRELDNLRSSELKNYYERLLNTNSYLRLNSTHEFTTSFNVWRFLNVTPKTGFGYSGYYDVAGVGADNRYLGYIGCDFDIKFHRYFERFRVPFLGMKGLTHIIRPYASMSHCSISSSNELVPKLDTWSSTFGSSTSNPMSLDLMGFTGIDGWGKWTVWRMGAQNVFSTLIDGEPHIVLNWNAFIDYNVENPNTGRRFSNLYSFIQFNPTERFRLTLETQTPTIKEGDGFSQYNTAVSYQPFAWLEGVVGHRYIRNHPIQEDASQVYIQSNIRLNERHTLAGRWYWDTEQKRLPIQQYSVFRKTGVWYIGATLFLRDNGGRKETGFGLSFTLGETGTAFPVKFF